MYIWYLGTTFFFFFWVMRGRASIWEYELCASIWGSWRSRQMREREREKRSENSMTFCLFLEREFNDLMI